MSFTTFFRGQQIGTYRLDLLVENTVIIECKAAESIHSAHVAQLIHYLKATGLPLGLLLNFGPKAAFVRRVNTIGPSDNARQVVVTRCR